MSDAFAREHKQLVDNGRAMLALWAGGVLATLKASRENDQAELDLLESNAKHALRAVR